MGTLILLEFYPGRGNFIKEHYLKFKFGRLFKDFKFKSSINPRIFLKHLTIWSNFFATGGNFFGLLSPIVIQNIFCPGRQRKKCFLFAFPLLFIFVTFFPRGSPWGKIKKIQFIYKSLCKLKILGFNFGK